MTKILTDRSRILSYQNCPRRFWYEYGVYGQGIRGRNRIELEIGLALHRGTGALRMGWGLEPSLAVALDGWNLIPEVPTEDEQYVEAEAKALVEGLVRGYFHIGLPRLLAEYKILEVEREYNWELAPGITFMSRVDALLESRDTGELYIQSDKTTKRLDARIKAEGEHDDQGISELLAVEQSTGRTVIGIRMEYFLKGNYEEWPKDSGRRVHRSPFVEGWMNGSIEGGGALSSEYTRKKGWGRFHVSQFPGGVRSWIEWLLEYAPETIESQFIAPVPHFRNPGEIESWRAQITNQVEYFSTAARVAEETRLYGYGIKDQLDARFPQHRRACNWPKACPFKEICWGPVSENDPLASGDFVLRVPNHSLEGGKFDGKKA